jgi:hypothetical protein
LAAAGEVGRNGVNGGNLALGENVVASSGEADFPNSFVVWPFVAGKLNGGKGGRGTKFAEKC